MKVYDFEEIQKKTIEEIYSKIIHGNNIDVLKELPENSIDLIVTSPPYDDLRDYEKKVIWDFEKFKIIAQELYKVMKVGGVIVWVVGDKTKNGNKSLTSFKQSLYFQEIGFNIFDVIIYEKTGSGPPHPNRYFNTFEYMFIISKGKPKTINLLRDKPNKWAGVETYAEVTRREVDGTLTKKGKKKVNDFGIRTNIWKYVNGKGFATKDKIAHKHPAIFPEKLAQDHILSWSNEGDVVLDIFGGSGTTIKQAELLNRKWIYIDKVEEYCKIAMERMENLNNE
ncbi:DNA-methyltransferase [Aliarcobacter butzleri]|uniref:DNA-methyltransferase n=1 Tax=Aliarcobacter butzleri TaxID=28197 RepID=UPI002B251CDE|nr:site-specific DNA-methyltransferase [Aliarcobacter butzleri]